MEKLNLRPLWFYRPKFKSKASHLLAGKANNFPSLNLNFLIFEMGNQCIHCGLMMFIEIRRG